MERISRNHFLRLALGGTVATGLAMVGLADRSVSPPTAEPVPTKSAGEPNPTFDQPLQGVETPFQENEDGETIYTGSNPTVVEPNPTAQPISGIETPSAYNEDGETFPTGGQVRLTPQAREGILTPVTK